MKVAGIPVDVPEILVEREITRCWLNLNIILTCRSYPAAVSEFTEGGLDKIKEERRNRPLKGPGQPCYR